MSILRSRAATIMQCVALVIFWGCNGSGPRRVIAPECDSLLRLKDLLPQGQVDMRDTSYRWLASGEFYQPDLQGCLFRMDRDRMVLVVEDWSASDDLGVRYADIFIVEGTTRTSTSFPKSADFVVEQAGDTTLITFHYLYRVEYDVRLAYRDGRLSVITHQARR